MNADNDRANERHDTDQQPSTVSGSIVELREFLKRQQSNFEDERQCRTSDGIIDEPEPYRVRVEFRSSEIANLLLESLPQTSSIKWWKWLATMRPKSSSRQTKELRAFDADTSDAPPKWTEYALFLFLPKKHRENIPGDLREEFCNTILPRFGSRAARNWYRYQVVCAIMSLWPRRVLATLGLSYLARRLPGLERWLGG